MSEIAPVGLIDEHAPRNEEHGGPATYTPTPEERKTIKLAERVFEKNKKHRTQYDSRWMDYYHFFRGKQWKEQRPSFRHSEVINLVFRTIQSMVPIQADPKPRFDFEPEEPQDLELAKLMSDVAEADWTKNNWGEQLLEVLYDANIYGTGMSEMCVKPDRLTKEDKLTYESTDLFYCFPDVEARDVNKNATTFVHAQPMDIRQVRKKYPQLAEYLKPDLQDLTRASKTDFTPYKFRSPIDNKVIMEGSPTLDLISKEKALVITVYLGPDFVDNDVKDIEVSTIDPETGAEMKGYQQQLEHPNGRKIVVVNGVLCEDDPLPFDDLEFPFQRLPNYILPREFWGVSEIEQLEGPQKIFNKVVNFALDVLTLTGNPIWLVPTTSGVDPENLTNRPGLSVEYDGEKPPVRQEGTQLQPYVFQLVDKLAEWFDSISGSQDITRGVQPTGITAASAIANLQEAAQTRIRLKSRLLDSYLQTLGQQYLSRALQFKTAPQVYRITNDQGATQYFKMHVEPYDKTHEATGEPTGEKGRQVILQPIQEDGTQSLDDVRTYQMRGKFDVKVVTGSSLPFAKAEKEARLKWLYEDKIIDATEVLKGLDYPNYQAIIDRMTQQAQQDAQAAAAAKAGAAPAA
jgi:hypothetical protein